MSSNMALFVAVLAIICFSLIHPSYAVPRPSLIKVQNIDVSSPMLRQAVDFVAEPSEAPVPDPEDPIEAENRCTGSKCRRKNRKKEDFTNVYKW